MFSDYNVWVDFLLESQLEPSITDQAGTIKRIALPRRWGPVLTVRGQSLKYTV